MNHQKREWRLYNLSINRREKVSMQRRREIYNNNMRTDKENNDSEANYRRNLDKFTQMYEQSVQKLTAPYFKNYRGISLKIRSGYRFLRATKYAQKKWIVRNIYKTIWRKRVHRKCLKRVRVFNKSTKRHYCASRSHRYRKRVCLRRDENASCVRKATIFGFRTRTNYKVIGNRVVTTKTKVVFPQLRCVKRAQANGDVYCVQQQVIRPLLYHKKYAVVQNKRRLVERGIFYGKNHKFTCAKRANLRKGLSNVKVCLEFSIQRLD